MRLRTFSLTLTVLSDNPVKKGGSMNFCFSSEKIKKYAFVIAAAVLLCASVIAALTVAHNSMYKCINGKKYCLKADTVQHQHDFAGQAGLEIGRYPLMIQKVRIPESSDPVYSDYYDLQSSSGFDLLPYAGKKCTLYTYSIISPENDNEMLLDLIVYNDRVVGGDISGAAYGGKISGIFK